ncbi:MAG: enoyl-CoA hydratase-related protein [Betaproteobacteria bacterium]
MSDRVIVRIDDARVAHVTLNRAEVHNAFDPAMVEALTSALGRIADDERVRAVVLRGAGRNFCAGADIEHMKKSATFSAEQNIEVARHSARMFHTLYALGKPTIACVQGAVRGGGCGLVAACDIAVAAPGASFRLSEVKIGVIPAMISPYVIAAIGERMARRYMITGEAFDAPEAQRIGLVHQVVDEAQLEVTVDAVLGHLATSGPGAVTAIKQLIPLSAHAPIGPDIIEETARRIAAVRATPEAQEGLAAFLEKRKPAWIVPAAQREPK